MTKIANRSKPQRVKIITMIPANMGNRNSNVRSHPRYEIMRKIPARVVQSNYSGLVNTVIKPQYGRLKLDIAKNPKDLPRGSFIGFGKNRHRKGRGVSDVLGKLAGYAYNKIGKVSDYLKGKKWLSTGAYSIAEALEKVPNLVPHYWVNDIDRIGGYLEHHGYGKRGYGRRLIAPKYYNN